MVGGWVLFLAEEDWCHRQAPDGAHRRHSNRKTCSAFSQVLHSKIASSSTVSQKFILKIATTFVKLGAAENKTSLFSATRWR